MYKSEKLSDHFSRSEFACHCGCGFDDVNPNLVALLEEIRRISNIYYRIKKERRIIINSGCRCKSHNEKVGGVKQSLHLEGKAADIKIVGLKWFGTLRIVNIIFMSNSPSVSKLGGVGIYPSKNFIHIDVGRERMWAG